MSYSQTGFRRGLLCMTWQPALVNKLQWTVERYHAAKSGRTGCAVNCTTRSSEEAPWGGTRIREHQHCATQNSALLFKYITSAISASVSVICVEQLHIYTARKGFTRVCTRNLRFSVHPIKHAQNKRKSKPHMCRLYPATTRIPCKLTAEVTTN